LENRTLFGVQLYIGTGLLDMFLRAARSSHIDPIFSYNLSKSPITAIPQRRYGCEIDVPGNTAGTPKTPAEARAFFVGKID
jgi:hypothetical protein